MRIPEKWPLPEMENGWLEGFRQTPVDSEFMGKLAQIKKLKNETLKLWKGIFCFELHRDVSRGC